MVSASLVLSPPLNTPATDVPPFLSTRTQTQSETTFNNFHCKLGSLKSCKNLQETIQLHGQLTKQGPKDDPILLTNLIGKYSQLGSSESLEYAEKAFRIFKSINGNSNSSTIYLYNSLIRGNSFAGIFNNAIFLYIDMLIDGAVPDNYTFPFLLSACAKSLKLSEGLQLHGSIVKLGFLSDIFVLNSLIYLYGECGEIDKGRKVFDEMLERNVVSWTSLICGYARRNRHNESVSLFFQMIEEGFKPNELTMVSVISSCAKLGDSGLGERVSDYVEGSGLTINSVMVNALVDMHMKCGAVDKGKQLFDECVDRNLVLYNTVISNYGRLGNVKKALDIYNQMLGVGVEPDRITMLSLLSASAELGYLCFGTQCHAYVLRHGLETSHSIGNSIIGMYAKCGMHVQACRVFDLMSNKTIVSWNSLLAGFAINGDLKSLQEIFNEMPERDLVSWNTMIGALAQHSLFKEAIEQFHCMRNEGITADKVTMVSVASSCGYLGAIDLAKWTYSYIRKYGIECDMQLSTALIDMFARCGDPESAMTMFNMMKERDVSAWTALIGAMAMSGKGERAVELFYDMIRQGVLPDGVVFVEVLTACSHSGLVERGMGIFNSMKEHGVTPNVVHYGCIVDLLGRAGLLDKALDFINSMPMEPNCAIWGAFMSACRIQKNEKLASLASDLITKSANDKAGIQILMSNIYASAGKWSGVAKVRMHMKEKGMKKTPGSSSIEVSGLVHEFTSGDQSHPEIGLTTSMLQEINCRLRDVGYVPDLRSVLLDVDEQEREFMLSRHSEKLAIAFGLISSHQGMPIRVAKNLRMCSDCHSFAKMVSKVYDRKIVIRDNKRFHFFQQGLCSCHDYW